MKKYETFLYSAAGLAALFIILVAFNYLSSSAAVRADLTDGRLYTLSDGTKKILQKLDGPVKLRLYVSQSDNAIPVQLRSFAQRVEDVVREFKSVAGPNLIIEKYNPRPDSDEEDAAQLDGVEPQTLFSGEQFYLGLSVSRLDRKQALSNISQQRERLLEYDLIRAISRVAVSERPTIGIMSAVPVLGEAMNPMTRQGSEPWVLAGELKRDFNVKTVPMSAEAIDKDINVLLADAWLDTLGATVRSVGAITQARPDWHFDAVRGAESLRQLLQVAAVGGHFKHLPAAVVTGHRKKHPARVKIHIHIADEATAHRTEQRTQFAVRPYR